jgi:chromate reductase
MNVPTSASSSSQPPRLLAFAATHRPISSNAQLLALAANYAKEAGAEVALHAFADFALPIFAEEIPTHETLPEGGQRFLAALEAADGLIIATPEYNWSFPAALKNLIDWISCLRPNPFAGKSVMLLSASPSRRGGLQGLLQLRVPLESLHMHVYPRYFALGEAAAALATPGTLTPPALATELAEITASYVRDTQHWKHRK